MRHLMPGVAVAGSGCEVARVEVITDEKRCGIDPCSPAVIGRCSQCALVRIFVAIRESSCERHRCRPCRLNVRITRNFAWWGFLESQCMLSAAQNKGPAELN